VALCARKLKISFFFGRLLANLMRRMPLFENRVQPGECRSDRSTAGSQSTPEYSAIPRGQTVRTKETKLFLLSIFILRLQCENERSVRQKWSVLGKGKAPKIEFLCPRTLSVRYAPQASKICARPSQGDLSSISAYHWLCPVSRPSPSQGTRDCLRNSRRRVMP